MNIHKPTREQLQALLGEGQARELWVDGFLAMVKRVILNDPLRYRSFGPWWGLVKAAYLKREDTTFGETVEDSMNEVLTYGDEATDLLAAFAYQDMQVNRGILREAQHVLDTDDGSEKYFSNDEEMEQRALAR